MKKLLRASMVAAIAVLFIITAAVSGDSVFPSTNDLNRTNGWAHVNEQSVGLGEVTLQFVGPRNFYSCFEYRTDGDTSQMTSPTNYNTEITDGLYPYLCVKNNSSVRTFHASEYVEVRLSFGAEKDERFAWTRFDVIPMPVPAEKDECKDGGWQDLYRPDGTTFKNQGDCVQFVETGK